MASSDSEDGASSSGQTKRPRLSQDTSKHLVGYRQSWAYEELVIILHRGMNTVTDRHLLTFLGAILL